MNITIRLIGKIILGLTLASSVIIGQVEVPKKYDVFFNKVRDYAVQIDQEAVAKRNELVSRRELVNNSNQQARNKVLDYSINQQAGQVIAAEIQKRDPLEGNNGTSVFGPNVYNQSIAAIEANENSSTASIIYLPDAKGQRFDTINLQKVPNGMETVRYKNNGTGRYTTVTQAKPAVSMEAVWTASGAYPLTDTIVTKKNYGLSKKLTLQFNKRTKTIIEPELYAIVVLDDKFNLLAYGSEPESVVKTTQLPWGPLGRINGAVFYGFGTSTQTIPTLEIRTTPFNVNAKDFAIYGVYVSRTTVDRKQGFWGDNKKNQVWRDIYWFPLLTRIGGQDLDPDEPTPFIDLPIVPDYAGTTFDGIYANSAAGNYSAEENEADIKAEAFMVTCKTDGLGVITERAISKVGSFQSVGAGGSKSIKQSTAYNIAITEPGFPSNVEGGYAHRMLLGGPGSYYVRYDLKGNQPKSFLYDGQNFKEYTSYTYDTPSVSTQAAGSFNPDVIEVKPNTAFSVTFNNLALPGNVIHWRFVKPVLSYSRTPFAAIDFYYPFAYNSFTTPILLELAPGASGKADLISPTQPGLYDLSLNAYTYYALGTSKKLLVIDRGELKSNNLILGVYPAEAGEVSPKSTPLISAPELNLTP